MHSIPIPSLMAINPTGEKEQDFSSGSCGCQYQALIQPMLYIYEYFMGKVMKINHHNTLFLTALYTFVSAF